jgi:serine O-acetyltransferase
MRHSTAFAEHKLTTRSISKDRDHEMFDNLREDWDTHERDIWRQGLWVMAVYRFGRWRYGFRHRIVRAPLSFVYKLLFKFIQIITGIELPCEANIGRRFRIDHFGGVIISGDVVFGDDVVIRNGVTIGLRRAGVRGSPKIGNRVDIGAGAKILGPITIGDDTTIGANAVVLEDVPPNSSAIGIPARTIPRRLANSARRVENVERLSQS